MAISTLNNKIIYTGNGSQTTFVYPFQYDVIGDIQVWVYGIGDIIGQRVYNFTASTASGNLTFTYPVSGSPLPAGHKLLLLRSTSLTQNIDLEEQSTVSLETLEKGYDKACLQLQDAQEKLTRAVIYSPVTGGEISGEELEADIVTTKATATQALALAQTVNSALPNKADLVDGKVPLYQLPETFEDVPSDNQSYVRKNKAWSNLTSDLNTINNRLNAAEGIGGYLQAYNFGVATPTATQLNDYALSQITSISTPSEIFNGTRVKNTFDNNLWVLANTPNTVPPVFEWINNGLDTVSIATTTTAGVIKASAATGGVAVAADGTTSVNGFNDKFDKTGGVLSGDITIERDSAHTASINLKSGIVSSSLSANQAGINLYRTYNNRLKYDIASNKWYVYKNDVAKELGLTDASELSYSGPVSAATVKGAIEEVDAKAEAVASDLADTEINGIAIAGKNNTCDDLGLQCALEEGNNITKTQVSESEVKVLLNFDDSVTDSSALPLTYTQPTNASYGPSLFANSPTKKSIQIKSDSEYGGAYGPYATGAKPSLNFNNHDWTVFFTRKATTLISSSLMLVYGSRENDDNYCNIAYDGRISLKKSGSFKQWPVTSIPQTAGAIEHIALSFESATGKVRVFKNGTKLDETTSLGTIFNFGFPNSPYACIAYGGGSTFGLYFSGVQIVDYAITKDYTPSESYPTTSSITKDVIACKNYFGEIYTADNSTAQTIPTGATYTKSTAFNTAGKYRGVTLDAANNKIILPSAGYYKVGVTGSSKLGSAGITLKTALFLGGVKVPSCQAVRKINNANDESTVSFGGIVKVDTANSEIDVRVSHDNGGDVSLTTVFCNLNAVYIGDLTL